MLKIHTFAVTINFNIMIPMKKVLFITLLLICSLLANAQIKVTGTVYSEADRETLIGATVIIEGAGNGTITDVDGKFAITCNADTTPIQRQISCNCQNDKKSRVNTNIYSI